MNWIEVVSRGAAFVFHNVGFDIKYGGAVYHIDPFDMDDVSANCQYF